MKVFSNTYTTRETIDLLALSNAQSGDWQGLIENQHRLWGQFTSAWGGHCFVPRWETTSTGASYAAENDARRLNMVHLSGVAGRELEGGIVRVGVGAIGANIDLSVTITNVESATQLASYTVSTGGSGTYVLGTVELPVGSVTDGSGDLQLLDTDLKAASASGAGAILLQVRAGEVETSAASDLPDGL